MCGAHWRKISGSASVYRLKAITKSAWVCRFGSPHVMPSLSLASTKTYRVHYIKSQCTLHSWGTYGNQNASDTSWYRYTVPLNALQANNVVYILTILGLLLMLSEWSISPKNVKHQVKSWSLSTLIHLSNTGHSTRFLVDLSTTYTTLDFFSDLWSNHFLYQYCYRAKTFTNTV